MIVSEVLVGVAPVPQQYALSQPFINRVLTEEPENAISRQIVLEK